MKLDEIYFEFFDFFFIGVTLNYLCHASPGPYPSRRYDSVIPYSSGCQSRLLNMQTCSQEIKVQPV